MWAALAALALASAAALGLAFYPDFYAGSSTTVTAGGVTVQQSEHASLIAVNGAWVIALLAVPVALTCLALLGVARRQRVVVWIAAAVLIAFSVVSGFSIGLFFAPAAFVLLVAAALCTTSASRS
jgi:hypothetical protein